MTVSIASNSTLAPVAKASWVVRWNGEPRPTHASQSPYSSGLQISADIAASDIAQPGFSEVSILDTATGVVYPVNAFFMATVDITVADFAYDSVHNRFYVTVPAGGARPNAPAETVVSIDANTGAIGPNLNVGPKPTRLAVSDDGSYLYVYLSSSASIARIALNTFTPDIQFRLASANQYLLAMAVMPGSPGTIAVSQTNGANSGRVVIYDDGKSRSQTSADLIAANLLFADSSTIATGGYVSQMNVLKVSLAGITSASPIPGSGPQEVPLAVTSDTLFASSGKLYSLKTSQLLGNLETSGSAAFVPGRNRLVIAATSNTGGPASLVAFDPAAITALGRITLASVSSAGLGTYGARLVTWGTDGVALVAGQNLFIGHTPLAGPAPVWTAAGIVNTASESGGAIAPGEILSIYGANLGPTPGRSLELSAYRRVSTNLGGTEIWFDGLAGTMLYAGAGQINVVAPFGLAGKSYTKIQVWYGGIPSAQIIIPVVPVAPGIFTQNGSGSGPAAVLNADGSLNTAAQPAVAGTYATLFGTGGGVTEPASHDGVPAPGADMLGGAVRVLLNGQSVPILYAGSAPGLVAGVVQVNFQIPAGFPGSAAVNVQLEVAGVASASGATMAVQ